MPRRTGSLGQWPPGPEAEKDALWAKEDGRRGGWAAEEDGLARGEVRAWGARNVRGGVRAPYARRRGGLRAPDARRVQGGVRARDTGESKEECERETHGASKSAEEDYERRTPVASEMSYGTNIGRKKVRN